MCCERGYLGMQYTSSLVLFNRPGYTIWVVIYSGIVMCGYGVWDEGLHWKRDRIGKCFCADLMNIMSGQSLRVKYNVNISAAIRFQTLFYMAGLGGTNPLDPNLPLH